VRHVAELKGDRSRNQGFRETYARYRRARDEAREYACASVRCSRRHASGRALMGPSRRKMFGGSCGLVYEAPMAYRLDHEGKIDRAETD